MSKSVLQEWVTDLTMMQQSVLMTAIRGPDGVGKYHPSKYLLRWYRRCVLYCALEHEILTTPGDARGGSFTGPSYNHLDDDEWEYYMLPKVDDYLKSLDELPHHFQLHFMHGCEILGYKHPDDRIRVWWRELYRVLANDMHLLEETEEQLDFRLSDQELKWRSTSHKATSD